MEEPMSREEKAGNQIKVNFLLEIRGKVLIRY